jgi:hypothetical protein
MTDLSNISDSLIAKVVTIDDVDEALFEFQTAVGIDDGGIAGVVFSGGWDAEWRTASTERRSSMMAHYINVERSFAAGDEGSDEVEELDPGVAWAKNWL